MLSGFDRFSSWAARATGSPAAFALAAGLILIWLALGPFVGFTDTMYQLSVNSATTVITFLMVFLLQASQNRDAAALHLKLDALISVNRDLSNRLISIEHRPVEEIVEEAERMRVELRED